MLGLKLNHISKRDPCSHLRCPIKTEANSKNISMPHTIYHFNSGEFRRDVTLLHKQYWNIFFIESHLFNMVWSHSTEVNFLHNTHKRHPITCLEGWDMGVLCEYFGENWSQARRYGNLLCVQTVIYLSLQIVTVWNIVDNSLYYQG